MKTYTLWRKTGHGVSLNEKVNSLREHRKWGVTFFNDLRQNHLWGILKCDKGQVPVKARIESSTRRHILWLVQPSNWVWREQSFPHLSLSYPGARHFCDLHGGLDSTQSTCSRQWPLNGWIYLWILNSKTLFLHLIWGPAWDVVILGLYSDSNDVTNFVAFLLPQW